MDWNVVAQYLPLFEKAAWLTLRLGLAGIALAIVIGLVCALVQYYKVPMLCRVVGFYIQLSRNTPLLVQLFFLYYGLPKIGIRTDAAVCGIAGLAFLGGSYMAEAFRSGLESIEPIQTESAYSLGMDRMQTMRYVILPQAMSTSVPAFVANVIFLLKETSVFSAISLMDLMFTAKDLIGLYYKTTESLFLLVVFYLLILLPVSAAWVSAGKEAALCRIWGLTYCSRAKTWPACWAACGWPCASACFPSPSASRWASCWAC